METVVVRAKRIVGVGCPQRAYEEWKLEEPAFEPVPLIRPQRAYEEWKPAGAGAGEESYSRPQRAYEEWKLMPRWQCSSKTYSPQRAYEEWKLFFDPAIRSDRAEGPQRAYEEWKHHAPKLLLRPSFVRSVPMRNGNSHWRTCPAPGALASVACL